MAASWLRWELQRAGVQEAVPELADVLLVTVSSQQGVAQVRGVLRRLKNKRARVIIGGGGAYAPAVFDPHMDVACVGEGVRFIRTLLTDGYDVAMRLPEAWVPGETRPVVPSDAFPWELPPVRHPDGTVRVFGSRGCKYRCLFCQTGWESTYRPNPHPDRLQADIQRLEQQGLRLAIVTNDGAEQNVKLSGSSEFLSVRLQNLKRLLPLSRQVTKSIRIGVEGISERLRLAVGKPVSNADLLNATFNLLANGIGVRWFFIPGLPGERDEDYDELRFLVRELHKLPKGCAMMNFHAFIPQPATPLCVLPLIDDYWERFNEFRRWFFHGPGFTRRVQIIAPARHPGRLARAKESMAATELELRRGWWQDDNANWRVRYRATPEQLRKTARVYAQRVGLEPQLLPTMTALNG